MDDDLWAVILISVVLGFGLGGLTVMGLSNVKWEKAAVAHGCATFDAVGSSVEFNWAEHEHEGGMER